MEPNKSVIPPPQNNGAAMSPNHHQQQQLQQQVYSGNHQPQQQPQPQHTTIPQQQQQHQQQHAVVAAQPIPISNNVPVVAAGAVAGVPTATQQAVAAAPPSSHQQQQQQQQTQPPQQQNHHHQQQPQPQQQQPPAAASQQHQEEIIRRVCDIFSAFFSREGGEEQCRREGRRYYLTRVIGHGATGIVINAKSTQTGAHYAVKIVDVASMSSSDKDRAMAEVHSLLSCNFFSVLKCHDDFVQLAVTDSSSSSSNNNNSGGQAAAMTDAQLQSTSVAPAVGSGGAGGALVGGDSSALVSSSSSKPKSDIIITSIKQPHPKLLEPRAEGTVLFKDPLMLVLVLDLANAGDLRQEIKNRARRGRPFKEHEVGLLFIQILMAVHHVHCKHMIHRDIKTANVFLCSNGLVKLGDFGFSKQYHDTVSDEVGRTFCGTPYYVAPEIWRRKPYSKKADMFSLGVLLYETLALRRPFEGNTMQEVMEKTLHGTYDPLPSTTSPEMQRIVKDLLSTDPARRPSSAQLLQYPLSKLFMDALVSIVQSGQPSFDDSIRSEVVRNVAETRATLRAPPPSSASGLRGSSSNKGGSSGAEKSATASSSANQVIVNNMVLNEEHIFLEGMVHKLSGDGQWKRRYLCIFRQPINEGGGSPAGAAGSPAAAASGTADPTTTSSSSSSSSPTANTNNSTATQQQQQQQPVRYEYRLLIAITKDTIRQQCIIAPCTDFEDVFPVPPRYAGANAEHVFSLVYRTGAKRLAFQAASEEDQGLWMQRIQIALGLEEEEESTEVQIPL